MLKPKADRCFSLTAPGTSALATIRLAGPGVAAFLDRRFSRRVTPGRPTHGELRDDRGVIDDPVVVLRADGVAVDLTLHGGASVARYVLALAEFDGFALAAVDVATIGSTDAATTFEHELLAALPHARTELAACVLLAQPAAWATFAAAPSPEALAAVLADRSLDCLLAPPTLAIVGLPNAGKSTLANALFGQQRSIVSDLAGTTRDWVGEEADLDGLIVRLIDTPGQRETADAIERAAIAASASPIGAADAVLLVLDGTRDDADQRGLLGRFHAALVVLNKADARAPAWTDARLTATGATPACARSGAGVDAVVRRVHERFGIDRHELTRPRAWTPRQRDRLNAGDAAGVLA